MPKVPDAATLLALAKSVMALWHVLAFSAGLVLVIASCRSLFGRQAYDRSWSAILRSADLHLWLSGFAIIVAGMAAMGVEKYLTNPKLWIKVVVVVVWTAATLALRRSAGRWLVAGQRRRMVAVSAVSLSCWLYGAFLGCAKDLAFGVAPFGVFLGGFAATLFVTVLAGLALEHQFRHQVLRAAAVPTSAG